MVSGRLRPRHRARKGPQNGRKTARLGTKAKAYANQFINKQLQSVANGKTYSQVSAAAQANPTDTKLAAQVQTLFRGETLRGLLLYAWGWSVVGHIASLAAWGAFIGAF